MLNGYLLSFIYSLVTASAIVFVSYLGTRIPIEVSLFYMALAGSIVFNIVEYKNILLIHKALIQNKLSWLLMSTAFLANCVFSYYSAVYAAPEFYVAVFFLTTALCSCLLERKKSKALVCGVAIVIICLLTNPNILPLCTSLLAGVSVFIYYITSCRFGKSTNLNPAAIVAVRCYALLLCTIFYLTINGEFEKILLSSREIGKMLFLVLTNIIIPSFLSQTCLQLLGIGIFARMNSLIPVLVFTLNSILLKNWIATLFITCTITMITLNYEILKKFYYMLCKFLRAKYRVR
jgi:hypothetical protein